MEFLPSPPLRRDALARVVRALPTPASRSRTHTQPAPKRICLFGLFGMENYGNEGSLEAMLMFLRATYPDATLSCVCINPGKVEHDHHVAAVPIAWRGPVNPALRLLNKLALTLPQKLGNWVVAIRHLRNFDILILPGTSPLCDYRAGSFGAPYALFRWGAAARLCGKRLFLVSVGAGPIQGQLSRWMLTYLARSAAYRSFRDTNSKHFMDSLGIDTKGDEVYPDLVFKLPVSALPASSTLTSRLTTIGVGLIDYNGWHGHARPDDSIYETYLAKMASLVTDLLEHGYRVRILVGEIADQRTVTGLQAALSAAGRLHPAALARIVVEPVHCLADVMGQLADTSIVVASRFHNVVSSLKAGRPTISLGYQAKNDAVMAEFGLARFCQHIERFDTDWVMQQVDEQLNNIVLYEGMIARKLSQLRNGVLDQEAVLAQMLFPS